MKVIVNFKLDLHPVSQLILSLLYRNEYDLLKRYFAVVFPFHLERLHEAGYVLTQGPYELKNIDSLSISIPKARALFGEAVSCESWIDEYRNLFLGKKAGVMGTRSVCIQKMNRFLEENTFSRQIIIAATQRYINSCKKDSYNYIQRADYFIYKEETVNGSRLTTSNLGTLCEEIQMLDEKLIQHAGWQKDAI